MMNDGLRRLLLREMERVMEMLRNDKCELNDAEAMKVVSLLCHEPMSKEQTLVYLGWSRGKFDDYVRRDMMPKGRTRSGFKELVWYKDEINDAIVRIKNQKFKI